LQLGSILPNASKLVLRLYERLDAARITPLTTYKEISALFDESLPEHPQPMASSAPGRPEAQIGTNTAASQRLAPVISQSADKQYSNQATLL